MIFKIIKWLPTLLNTEKGTCINSLNEANQILDKLEDKGIDAAVIDRRRK